MELESVHEKLVRRMRVMETEADGAWVYIKQ